MGKLVINHDMVTVENARMLVALCPFGAITYEKAKLDISAACKLCTDSCIVVFFYSAVILQNSNCDYVIDIPA